MSQYWERLYQLNYYSVTADLRGVKVSQCWEKLFLSIDSNIKPRQKASCMCKSMKEVNQLINFLQDEHKSNLMEKSGVNQSNDSCTSIIHSILSYFPTQIEVVQPTNYSPNSGTPMISFDQVEELTHLND